jgi:hypothetical protein
MQVRDILHGRLDFDDCALNRLFGVPAGIDELDDTDEQIEPDDVAETESVAGTN